MDKFSHHLHIRLTQDEHESLAAIMQRVGADRSSLARLALKRLFRKPPTRRFRYRPKRGASL